MRILYIDIDSCRPDHLGCYGYARPTSPVIDELAARGTLFRNCHASDAPCLPSRAAMFSVRFGINNGVTCHDGPASQLRYAGRAHSHDATRPMWMRYLQTQGWETVCFSGFGQRHLAWWFSAGFTQNFGNQLAGGSESADLVAGKVIDWLDGNGSKDNWFLHANFWDAHHPYNAPQKYFDRMAGKPTTPFPDAEMIQWDAEHIYGPRTARDWWFDGDWKNPAIANPPAPGTHWSRFTRMPLTGPETWESYLGFVNGHDAGIAYIDEKIGEILAALDRLGIRDETAIIITGDHGESIGELGMYFEHGNCCEGTTHVPLIVHWPGVTTARREYDGLTYQLDFPPSLLELLGMKIPVNWDGESHSAAITGKTTQHARDHLVLGTGIYSFQRAVRTSRHRLIRTIHSGLYPYDDLYLFDMQTDPCQRNNIAADQPATVAWMDHLMHEFVFRRTTGPAGGRDPFQEQLAAGIDPDLYCARAKIEARLQSQGRLDQLADLRKRRDPKPPLRPW